MELTDEREARTMLDEVKAELQRLELRMKGEDAASAPLFDAAASILAKLTRDHTTHPLGNESWKLMLMAEAAALCDRAEGLMREAQRVLIAGRGVRRRR